MAPARVNAFARGDYLAVFDFVAFHLYPEDYSKNENRVFREKYLNFPVDSGLSADDIY